MKTTHDSTAADDAQLARRLPPDLLKTVLGYEDELQRLKAKQPNPENARECRTADIEKLILTALTNARLLADIMAVTHSFRVSKVIAHFLKHKDRYQIAKPPSRAKIYAIMTQHGFML